MSAGARVGRRLLGLAFLLVIAALLSLTVAIYRGVFSTAVTVVLRTDHVGNQLAEQADVKVRGVLVGTVAAVRSDGSDAVVTLSLDPNQVALIPSTSTALLLPASLFGERYVALQPPPAATPAGRPLRDGDQLHQDTSAAGVELERVLDDLLPLIRSVAPDKLSATLSAVSDALSGRGSQLGGSLVQLNSYLTGLNPSLPDLTADLAGLADASRTYTSAAPAIIDALDDLTTTSRTVVEQRTNLTHLYSTVTAAAADGENFLAPNESNLIALAGVAKPTAQLLARYSAEFPCLFGLLAGFLPRMEQIVTTRVHITLEITNNRGKYVPGVDTPRYLDKYGPTCPKPAPPGTTFPEYPNGHALQDGSSHPPAVANPNTYTLGGRVPVPPGAGSTAPASAGTGALDTGALDTNAATGTDLGMANSPQEQRLIAELLSTQLGVPPGDVPGWASVLVGPLFRGTQVTLGDLADGGPAVLAGSEPAGAAR